MHQLTYKNPFLVLFFSIITAGIYFYYWLYVTTRELGECLSNDNDAALDLVLSILFLPYTIIWSFKTSQQVYIASNRLGLERPKNKCICYCLFCLFGFAPFMAFDMQLNLNRIIRACEI